MATLARKPAANAQRRTEWMARKRQLLQLESRLIGRVGSKFPEDGLRRARQDGGRRARAELKRLEAGGDAIVQGWAVGKMNDDSRYVLAGDGTLTPYDES
jgi:hypothetical protein